MESQPYSGCCRSIQPSSSFLVLLLSAALPSAPPNTGCTESPTRRRAGSVMGGVNSCTTRCFTVYCFIFIFLRPLSLHSLHSHCSCHTWIPGLYRSKMDTPFLSPPWQCSGRLAFSKGASPRRQGKRKNENTAPSYPLLLQNIGENR